MTKNEPHLSTAVLFAAAAEHHRAARLADAEKLYRGVLDLDPAHADSLHLLGVIALQTLRFAEADSLIARAIALNGRNPGYHNNRGLALQSAGKLDAAMACYEEALALNPRYAEAHYNLGIARGAAGRLDEAVECYRRALALKPGYAQAHNNLGNAFKDLGRRDEAEASYRSALAAVPGYAEAHNNLGNILREGGRLAEAVESYRRALELNPRYPDAHHNLGRVLGDQGQLDQAIESYRRALALRPEQAEAHNDLGMALRALRKPGEAVASYRRALELKPDHAEALSNLGVALQDLGQLEAAIESYRKAIALKPGFAPFHNNLGTALQDQGRLDAALASYETALALAPDDAEAETNLGTALVALGRIDEARHRFERAVRLAPRNPRHFRLLGQTRTFAAGDRELADLRALAQDADSLSEPRQVELHFALAKALDDAGARDEAFGHYLAGNALKRKDMAYDDRAVLEHHRRLTGTFSREAIAAAAGAGEPSPLPVFIMGMPRSGSTLIEQILASHPDFGAAGEVNDFETELARLYPAGVPEKIPPAAELRELGRRYVARLKARAPEALRITDKMLANFQHAGLIHLALPKARLIHSRRDPLDTCLSCFCTLFDKDNLPFAYDLAELGRHYSAYQRLMAHWRAALPAGILLEVDYEELVADLEGQARRIVAHCGLPWNDSCLSFHKASRAVTTASAAQVRRPLYRSSVGRWRPDPELLRPLTDALDGA